MHEKQVFGAIAYRRHVGATVDDIRTFRSQGEGERLSPEDIVRSLKEFEERGLVRAVGPSWFLTPAGREQAKGPALKPAWQSYDSWILAAVIGIKDSKQAGLDQIIGNADAIMHTGPSLGELHGALNRLASAGLIRARHGLCFAPSPRAQQLWSMASKRDLHSTIDNLRKLLDCPCCGVELKKVRWNIQLNQVDVSRAYKAYNKQFHELRATLAPKRKRSK